MDIRAPGTLNAKTLNHFQAPRWCAPSTGPTAVIDLSAVTFIDTLGLALVAATAERAFYDDVPVDFIRPQAPDPNIYMARMRLPECLAGYGIESEIPPVMERDTGTRLIELERFTDADYDPFAQKLYPAVIDLGGTPEDAKAVFQSISEVTQNVIQHSGLEGGWAAMQVLPDGNNREITFAIADCGRGLKESLSAANDVADHQDAIAQAFQEGVSGTGEPHRGMGLADLEQRVTGKKGIIRVWTGDASAAIRINGRKYDPLDTPFGGTLVYARWKPW